MAGRDVWSPSRDELVAMTPKPQTGPQYSDLSRIAMERAKTAREAVEIIAGPESFMSEWKDFSTFFRMLQYRILVEKPGLHDTLVNIQKANPMN